jgi:hypothetical protein
MADPIILQPAQSAPPVTFTSATSPNLPPAPAAVPSAAPTVTVSSNYVAAPQGPVTYVAATNLPPVQPNTQYVPAQQQAAGQQQHHSHHQEKRPGFWTTQTYSHSEPGYAEAGFRKGIFSGHVSVGGGVGIFGGGGPVYQQGPIVAPVQPPGTIIQGVNQSGQIFQQEQTQLNGNGGSFTDSKKIGETYNGGFGRRRW